VGLSSPPSESQWLREAESRTLSSGPYGAFLAYGMMAIMPCNKQSTAATRTMTARVLEVEGRHASRKNMQKC
jgi:hypothetical protein